MFLELPASPDASPRKPADGVLSRPERYLGLIAEAAGRLLAADDAAGMVEDLFELIRSELRLDVFSNFRIDPGDVLTLVASSGFTEAQAEEVKTLTFGQAVCGCAARDRQPMHVTEIQASDDPMLAFVKKVGLNAYACTPLIWGDRLLGTLGFGRRTAPRFDADELKFLHTTCRYVALAKHRLMIEDELRASLVAKERLLSELNHRVRNSLQLVASLTRLTRASAASPEIARALLNVEERVSLIAAVHQQLYRSENPERLAVERLLKAVIDTIGANHRQPVTLAASDGVGLDVSIDTAVPLGLLLQEVITAALAEAGVRSPVLGARRAEDGLRVEIDWGEGPAPRGQDKLAFAPILLRQLRGEWMETAGRPGILSLRLPADPVR